MITPEDWDRSLSADDWEEFEPEARLMPAVSRKWWKRIERKTVRRGWHSKTVQRMAAAALVLCLAGLGWRIWVGHRTAPGHLTAGLNRAFILRQQVNHGTRAMRIFMADGSTVDLAPGSGIKYGDPFATDGHRKVYLDGEASFEVVTEAAKPFEVYSGALATIVLGTSFTVNDFEQSPYIRVTLHTGKVLVRSPSHEVCLLPDQELWYNKSSMLATVRNLHRREGPTERSLDGKMVRMPDWYMFNNQSLAQVLDQLSSLYEVRIHYSATDLRGLYFIGRFDRTDSLDDILQDIALLNGLTVRRDSSQYFVKKKIH